MIVTNKKDQATAWLRVVALAVSAFIFNTTEFVPVGLLLNIGTSFDLSGAEVGIMITIYAWVVALMSLPLMLLTRNVERRFLLSCVFTIFIISHLVSALASSFFMLVLSRIGIALAHAIFWSITASLVVRVAPLGKKNQALGLLATGSALATVLGLPLGRLIGQYLGWRMTFLVIGFVAVVILLGLLKLLPKLVSENSGSLSSVPVLFKRPALCMLYLLIAIIITAHFTAYSYIEPVVQNIGGLSENFTTILLLIFGCAGILGSVIFSSFGASFPRSFLSVMMMVMMLCMLLLAFATTNAFTLIVLSIFWGVAMMAVGLAIQVRVLALASDATDVSMAIFSGIFNIGIGGGALLGSQVSLHIGMEYVGYVGSALAFFALLLCLFAFHRYHQLHQY